MPDPSKSKKSSSPASVTVVISPDDQYVMDGTLPQSAYARSDDEDSFLAERFGRSYDDPVLYRARDLWPGPLGMPNGDPDEHMAAWRVNQALERSGRDHIDAELNLSPGEQTELRSIPRVAIAKEDEGVIEIGSSEKIGIPRKDFDAGGVRIGFEDAMRATADIQGPISAKLLKGYIDRNPGLGQLRHMMQALEDDGVFEPGAVREVYRSLDPRLNQEEDR